VFPLLRTFFDFIHAFGVDWLLAGGQEDQNPRGSRVQAAGAGIPDTLKEIVHRGSGTTATRGASNAPNRYTVFSLAEQNLLIKVRGTHRSLNFFFIRRITFRKMTQ